MTRTPPFSSCGVDKRFVIPLLLTHISNIPRSPFIVVEMTPTLQFPRRIFPACQAFARYYLQNILWYLAALSKNSLFASSIFFLLGGGRFFFGGTGYWGEMLLIVAAAMAYRLVGGAHYLCLATAHFHMKASQDSGTPNPQHPPLHLLCAQVYNASFLDRVTKNVIPFTNITSPVRITYLWRLYYILASVQ